MEGRHFQNSMFSLMRPKSKFWCTEIFVLVPRTWLPSFKPCLQKMSQKYLDYLVVVDLFNGERWYIVISRRISDLICWQVWLAQLFLFETRGGGREHCVCGLDVVLFSQPRISSNSPSTQEVLPNLLAWGKFSWPPTGLVD